ncbi:MAG: hypothetical protein IPM29_25300 [Planctomycetes bacterium]|nr:hypothetical protein [Planctomycetota bacterium]
MLRTSLATVLLLAPLASAQGFSFITPVGSEFFEGNSSSNIMLGNLGTSTRVQQIDSNLVGRGLPLVSYLGWRRDGAGGGQQKTTTLTIVMSHADINAITSTFATNYKDPPQTVFAMRPVNLPDWSAAMPAAPFDTRITLDFPFVYNNVDAILWDVKKDNDPGIAYPQDWVATMPTNAYGDLPVPLSAGCTTPNGAMVHRTCLRVTGANLEFGFRVEGAPSSTAVSLLLGFSDPNVAVPGLCANVRTLVEVTAPLGAANAGGAIGLGFPFSIPWNAAYANAPLFTQAIALDPSQPGLSVALSGGLLTPAPASATATPIRVLRIYNTSSSSATTGTGPTASACPTIYGL